jgi:CMP-N,N'-diacetyllegionaminic acid synthase
MQINKNDNFLALIPARSGSKGINNKNLKKISYKKTLIELAYDVAKKSKFFDKIIVSTDSKIYKKYLESKKIFTPYLRPKKLAKDQTTDLELLNYELKKYEKYFNKRFDYVCLLQPTSPNRKIKHLADCIKKIKKNYFDSVWTISKIDKKFHPIKILKIQKEKIKYYNKDGSSFINRQALEDLYIRNGVAYFFSRNTILKKKSILPINTGYVIIKENVINIDTLEDLQKAKRNFRDK